MLRFFKETDINFIGFRRKGLVISAILIIVGIVSVVRQGGLNYGLDFTGGSFIELHFDEDIGIEQIRSSIADVG
ncbi:protein translocase subunit SecF, partial [candidate division WOR-3 bacterium]|nr:protein translocase subunit SecF [candidate division WOR-3 bacterium]